MWACVAGCSGNSTSDPEAVDAAAGRAGNEAIVPQTDAPPPEGDGRLVDIPEASLGDGWDYCGSNVRSSDGVASNGLAASRGTEFIVVRQRESAERSQVGDFAFFFQEPQQATALWFDMALLEGVEAGASLVVSESLACEPQRTLGEVQLQAGDLASDWTTFCVSLGSGALNELALQVISPNATLAIDAFRFGPACP